MGMMDILVNSCTIITIPHYSKLHFCTHINTTIFLWFFQTGIREELSKMSFEELQKLKEELGSKVYNEAMFGAHDTKKTSFKRENKNR